MNKPEHAHKKITVGLSGGVDSALTAAILQKEGYDVTAIFMQNWDAEDPNCTASNDLSDARSVCDQLGIPLETVNFSKAYWDQVFSHCLDEFAAGRTPNPDVLCNREIKFSLLLDAAKATGASHLATGHYARIVEKNGLYQLHKGVDENKDQSYFLYLLNQDQLSCAAFPLGEYQKPTVRAMASDYGLVNANKKDSTGICFVGERRFKPFLQEFLQKRPGIIESCDGEPLGEHDGVMFYTLGQRQGLDIGGRRKGNSGAWYVVEKDMKRNVIIAAQDPNHPKLMRHTVSLERCHFIDGKAPDTEFQCSAKMRYRQPDQVCSVTLTDNQEANITFLAPQRALTPGQSVVLYADTHCLGGGSSLARPQVTHERTTLHHSTARTASNAANSARRCTAANPA